jgi:4'-phosphopantetheinyl transferase
VPAAEVWQARLDVGEATLRAMEQTLSAAERAYARGIRDPLTRWRWVADHGWRRRLLGRLLEVAPEAVAFTVDGHGRPDVAGVAVSFSASRSGTSGVYAASRDAVVGVDVEELRADVDVEGFARRFFSPGERRALERLPAQERLAGCFACWTRKEAWAKAVGTGLVFPLTEREVWAGDDRRVRLEGFEITTLELGGGRAAALAAGVAPGEECQIRVSDLQED